MSDGRRMLGRDIRLLVEEETSRAFHGDCVDPGYPDICRRVARRCMTSSCQRSRREELWEAWNLGGLFLGRELFPDVPDTLAELAKRGYRLASITNRGYGGPEFWDEVSEFGLDQMFEDDRCLMRCRLPEAAPAHLPVRAREDARGSRGVRDGRR